MFSDQEIAVPTGEVKLLAAPETSARIRQDAKKSRSGIGPDGAKLSAMRAITLRDGLFEAILHHMIHDERLIAYGEECREWGGAFGVYRGLSDILPYERLFNSPISEAAIVATAVGHALEGGRSAGRTDVRRLHRPGRRRDLQPDGQVAVHVGAAC